MTANVCIALCMFGLAVFTFLCGGWLLGLMLAFLGYCILEIESACS